MCSSLICFQCAGPFIVGMKLSPPNQMDTKSIHLTIMIDVFVYYRVMCHVCICHFQLIFSFFANLLSIRAFNCVIMLWVDGFVWISDICYTWNVYRRWQFPVYQLFRNDKFVIFINFKCIFIDTFLIQVNVNEL